MPHTAQRRYVVNQSRKMPRPRKPGNVPRLTPQLNTRLAAEDLIKLENVCRAEGKTKTEILRKAVLMYIDGYEQKEEAAKRDRLAEAIEGLKAAMEVVAERQTQNTERLAKLSARTLIDIGTVQQVFFERASKEDRMELWAVARKRAVERLQKKRKDGDPEATEIMQGS
jgi:hypothetical protein